MPYVRLSDLRDVKTDKRTAADNLMMTARGLRATAVPGNPAATALIAQAQTLESQAQKLYEESQIQLGPAPDQWQRNLYVAATSLPWPVYAGLGVAALGAAGLAGVALYRALKS